MSITTPQTGIRTGLTFGAYLEKKPDQNQTGTSKPGFGSLLKQTTQSQSKSTGEEAETAVKAEVEEAKKLVKNYQTVLVKEILYGTSNAQYQAEKKKNKKYRLFKADNGVFGDKTLEEMANPTDDPKATWNSAQSKKLTKDQLRFLKEIYHLTNLSGEGFEGIITELIDKQIFSEEEAERLQVLQVPFESVQSGSFAVDKKAFEKK